jgi:hypothetical protein
MAIARGGWNRPARQLHLPDEQHHVCVGSQTCFHRVFASLPMLTRKGFGFAPKMRARAARWESGHVWRDKQDQRTEMIEGLGHIHIWRREGLLLLAAAAALQAIAWLVILEILISLLRWGYDPKLVSPDVAHYADVGTRVLGGQWPYAGFPLEYPPLSILLFIIAPVRGTLATYHHWFAVEMVAIDAITAVLTGAAAARIWAGLERSLAAVAALAMAVVAMGAIAIQVYDGAVATVFALAVLCLVSRRWTLAGLVVGLGFSLKLMPIVLLPLVLILACTRRRALLALLAGVVGAVAPFLPFVIHNAAAVTSSLFGAQIARGLQIESVGATPYLIAQVIHRGAVTVTVPPGGSLTINGPGAGLVESLAPATVLLLLIVVYWAAWRSRDALRGRPESTPTVALAAVLAALCGNKVLSPQHLLWVLPLVALCLVSRGVLPKVGAVLTMGAMVLTQVEFPAMYFRQIDLDSTPLLVISARNALLVAAFVVIVIAVARLRQESQAVAAIPESRFARLRWRAPVRS